MSDEIEAFLRRAAQRRAQKQPDKPATPPPRPQPAIEIYDDEVVEADVAEVRDTVAPVQHDYYADTQEEEDPHQAALMEKMRQLEEQKSLDPEANYDYDSQETEGEKMPPLDLHGLLSRPSGFRDAVILNEIFNRPKRF